MKYLRPDILTETREAKYLLESLTLSQGVNTQSTLLSFEAAEKIAEDISKCLASSPLRERFIESHQFAPYRALELVEKE